MTRNGDDVIGNYLRRSYHNREQGSNDVSHVTTLLEMIADEVITNVNREVMTCNGDDVIGNGCRRYEAITNVDREAMTCNGDDVIGNGRRRSYHTREQGSYDV